MNPLVANRGVSLSRRLAVLLAAVILAAVPLLDGAETPPRIGADQPWTTYEAETMRVHGVVLGPTYGPHQLEMEASHRSGVKLATAGDYVEFTATAEANALIVRYSLPDAAHGGGLASDLEVLVNGQPVRSLALTSRYAHLYGSYPFTNDPAAGKPRNFFDEVRVKGLAIAPGDVVRLRRSAASAVDCIVDLVDTEQVPAPLPAPAGALSVREFGAAGDGRTDDTAALKACVAAAQAQGRSVWVPAGDYRVTGDIVVPSGVMIQGAGLWHTTFVGDETLYGDAARRVRFKLVGRGIRLADFAIVGRLNYRIDDEPNDGVMVAGCADSAIERLWIEHTKVGVWVYNGTQLRIEGCRFRNLLADGVNLCVGTSDTVIENCSARGVGDDCFAIWPAPADQGFVQQHPPGGNVIRRCTGQLPFLANGASIYGGASNRIEDCLFTDIAAGCGILISTTFQTADEAGTVDNNFSGTTVVRGCRLVRCGGYDHVWGWRGALQICMDRRSIRGLAISQVEIEDSLSDAVAVAGPGSAKGQGTLTNATIEQLRVSRVGVGTPSRHGLWVRSDAQGELVLAHAELPDVRNDSSRFVVRTEP